VTRTPHGALFIAIKTESRNYSVLCRVVNRRRQMLVNNWVRR